MSERKFVIHEAGQGRQTVWVLGKGHNMGFFLVSKWWAEIKLWVIILMTRPRKILWWMWGGGGF